MCVLAPNPGRMEKWEKKDGSVTMPYLGVLSLPLCVCGCVPDVEPKQTNSRLLTLLKKVRGSDNTGSKIPHGNSQLSRSCLDGEGLPVS